MDFTKFKFNLTSLVEARGMTIAELGAKTNMAPTTIHRYLSGNRTPDLANVIRLCEFFGVSVDWLLGFSGEQYNTLSRELQDVVDCYEIASPSDRRVIQAVLGKYRKE